MASPDLQTLRMKAFTDMMRSGRSLFEEITKETPDEKREAEWEDYKRRALFKHNLEEDAKYSAEKAMKEAKQTAMLAEYQWQETYNLTAEQSATDLRSTADFDTTIGLRNKEALPGERRALFGTRKFKHKTMDDNLMVVLKDKMETIDIEMAALKRFEQGKAKYGGSILPQDQARIAQLKKEVNELYQLIGKDSTNRAYVGKREKGMDPDIGKRRGLNLYEKMQKRRGTKDETVRATFNTYAANIAEYKAYLDRLSR
tara:strand:+ start:85 stop:855 length:771 start_codon:yes stop_codon:yes gene_type:complete